MAGVGVDNLVRDDDWNNYLAVRAAWLSFVGGRTQGDIAARLGVSPAKVHRLIAHAQRSGFVKIRIEGRPIECLEMEDALCSRFGLQSCTVAPELGASDAETTIRAVASAAGNVLAGLFASPDLHRIGVGMGRTLKASVEAMPRVERQDVAVISISGSLMPKLSANPYDVVQPLLERTGGEGYYLPVPYFADSVSERDVFLGQASVQELLERALLSDVFVIGIGSILDDGHLVQRGLISRAEQEQLRARGVVCDLMGKFLMPDGAIADVDIGERSVGLSFEDVRGKRVIALAGGENKAEATLAAMRTGVITDLVTEETLARALCHEAGIKRAELV